MHLGKKINTNLFGFHYLWINYFRSTIKEIFDFSLHCPRLFVILHAYFNKDNIAMGGFFGTIAVKECVNDLFYGTDYQSHLGTKRAGLLPFAI